MTCPAEYGHTLAECLHCAYSMEVRTLHLRNFPDDVMDRLERMARASNMSVTAVAIRELSAATWRVDNAALVATLPDLKIPAAAVAEAVQAERR